MKLLRRSPIAGVLHALEIPMSEDEFITRHTMFLNGAFIQEAFPNLSADLREYILSGITPEEWDKTFS